MAKLKGIVRHIARREANHQQGDWFKTESRRKLRRLARLGILAYQPAVAAYCKVSDKERETITESLLTQKAGGNPKNMKIFKERRKTNEEFIKKHFGMMAVRKGVTIEPNSARPWTGGAF